MGRKAISVSGRGWTRVRASVAVAGVFGLALGVLAPSASAAPGDAEGTALRVALAADAGSLGAIVTAAGTVASVSAPPSREVSALDVAAELGDLLGVTAATGVASASATSTSSQSQGRSEVSNLGLSILGSPTSAAVLSGEATCPTGGAPVASTVVTDLSVLGQTVDVTVEDPTAEVSAEVSVEGLTDAVLTAAVETGIEETIGTTATATALRITFTLNAVLDGALLTIPVGTVEAGRATCTAPLAAVAPTATGLTPDSGSTDGGDTVTVTGTGFVPGDTSVTIGGVTVPANRVTVTSPTTLTFVTPAHAAGPVGVTVTTPGGTTGPQTFTYVAAPTAAGLAPDSGSTDGGDIVTVTGTGFVPGDTSVAIGGVTVPANRVTVISPTTLAFVTPAHAAGPVGVRVTTPGGTTGPQTFTYLAAAAPTATGVAPDSGSTAGGTTVTVAGTGFVPGATSVTIGGVTVPAEQVRVASPTRLTFDTPAHAAGAVDLTVTTPNGTTDPQTFTYASVAAPGSNALDPNAGTAAGGTGGAGTTGTGAGFETTAASASGVDSLPATGAPSALPLLLALLLLASGALLVVGSRRRA